MPLQPTSLSVTEPAHKPRTSGSIWRAACRSDWLAAREQKSYFALTSVTCNDLGCGIGRGAGLPGPRKARPVRHAVRLLQVRM